MTWFFQSFLSTSNTLVFLYPFNLCSTSICFLSSVTGMSRKLATYYLYFTCLRNFDCVSFFLPSTANLNILNNTANTHYISLRQPLAILKLLRSHVTHFWSVRPQGEILGDIWERFSSLKKTRAMQGKSPCLPSSLPIFSPPKQWPAHNRHTTNCWLNKRANNASVQP